MRKISAYFVKKMFPSVALRIEPGIFTVCVHSYDQIVPHGFRLAQLISVSEVDHVVTGIRQMDAIEILSQKIELRRHGTVFSDTRDTKFEESK